MLYVDIPTSSDLLALTEHRRLGEARNGIVREGAREFLVEAEVDFCLQSRAKAQEFLVVMVEKAIKVLDALEVVPEFL